MKNARNSNGFMVSIIHGKHLPTEVKDHPNIPFYPSMYDGICSTMSFVKQQIKPKMISCKSLTFHLSFFWKESEIKTDKFPMFNLYSLKLGGFHQLISFMVTRCNLMQDAGFKEVWSTVYEKTLFQRC